METWPSLVYGTGLENRRTFARPVGPNPTVSSKISKNPVDTDRIFCYILLGMRNESLTNKG